MLLQNARLIFASTPEKTESACKNILEGQYNGEPICEYFNCEWICPLCKENELRSCSHRANWRPPMHQAEVIKICEVAYGASDDFNQEIMGTQVESPHRFIHKTYIESWKKQPNFVTTKPPRYIYISCDPSGSHGVKKGNNRSDYAICAGYFDEDTHQYVVNIYINI